MSIASAAEEFLAESSCRNPECTVCTNRASVLRSEIKLWRWANSPLDKIVEDEVLLEDEKA